MPQQDPNNNEHTVPGRLTLEEIHKEREELLEAKKAMSGGSPNMKLFSAMSMFNVGIDFALILALPLIVGIYLGKWLDNKYSTKHYVLICILVAIFISGVGIYKQIIKLSKQVNKK